MPIKTTPAKPARQHNAHVRARARLITRVIDRAWDWRVGGMNGLTTEERATWAAAGVAAYPWSVGWGTRAATAWRNAAPYKDIPAHVIHGIMVEAMGSQPVC